MVINDYGKNIRQELDRWEELNTVGGNDPFCEDGVNMNLCRNHIIYWRKKIEEEMEEGKYPEEYYLELPPKVKEKYMARAEVISKEAEGALATYLEDPNYQYLQSVYPNLSVTQRKETNIGNVLGYVRWLTQSIESNNLLDMRRLTRTKIYAGAFKSCKAKIDALLGRDKQYPDNYQISIFDLL